MEVVGVATSKDHRREVVLPLHCIVEESSLWSTPSTVLSRLPSHIPLHRCPLPLRSNKGSNAATRSAKLSYRGRQRNEGDSSLRLRSAGSDRPVSRTWGWDDCNSSCHCRPRHSGQLTYSGSGKKRPVHLFFRTSARQMGTTLCDCSQIGTASLCGDCDVFLRVPDTIQFYPTTIKLFAISL